MAEKHGPLESKVEFFGLIGAKFFDDALNSIHGFAQATGCPPGADVFNWISKKHLELVAYDRAKLDAKLKARASNHEGEGA